MGVLQMKRISILLVALIFTAASWTTPASALIPPHTKDHSSGVFTDGINNFDLDQANMLNKLGLFLGTGNGYALERGMTRAEAAAMLVRFLGEEKTALSREWEHPFSDVPEWADRYVGWLYQNKLTKGTSEKKYSSQLYVTYWQYATFLSRACSGGDDFLAAHVGKTEEQALSEQNKSFTRADAVGLSVRALNCVRTIDAVSLKTMAQFLIEKEVFTKAQWLEAAPNVFPIEYVRSDDNHVVGVLAGVEVLKSTLAGVVGIAGVEAESVTSRPHIYAATFDEAGAAILYQMDCLTLRETWLGRYPRDLSLPNALAPYVEFLGTIGDVDYLRIQQRYNYSLIRVDGAKAETIADGIVSNQNYNPDYFISDKAILVMTADAIYIMTGDASRRRTLTAGSQVAALDDNVAVVYRRENGKTVVEGINVNTWSVVDRYEVAQSADENIPALRRQSDEIYGPAGWYAVSESRLRQITARPTLAVGFMREGAGSARVIVSGANFNAGTGTTIVRVGDSWDFGGEETVLLTNDPPHDIEITGLSMYSEISSTVQFFSAHGVGMERYDIYTYELTRINRKPPAIWVLSYEAGRPEMMEHDEPWYVQREQERLNKLGYRFELDE